VSAATQSPHRPGPAPVLGLRAGSDGFSILSQTDSLRESRPMAFHMSLQTWGKRPDSRSMKTKWLFALAALIGCVPGLTPGSARAQSTYTVLVGAEDTTVGASVNAYFPNNLTIRTGDTVHWQRNANEIHTVTFLAGTPLPPLNVPAPAGLPSPVMRNPAIANPTVPANGQYDGTTFAGSGILGPDASQPQSLDLTFTTPGTYPYLCAVHGVQMSGKVNVVDDPVNIPSPDDANQEAKRLIGAAMDNVPLAYALANIPPTPAANPDGTSTYQVLVGYQFGPLELFQFFPNLLAVNPGDTVVFSLSADNHAPHTVTFLNGNASPDDVLPVPQDTGPPLLVVNPAVSLPQNAGQPLTKDGIFSSGILRPGTATTSFSLQIGDITGEMKFQCLLHDSSGMLGSLQVVPR
jgi:plastocyanin